MACYCWTRFAKSVLKMARNGKTNTNPTSSINGEHLVANHYFSLVSNCQHLGKPLSLAIVSICWHDMWTAPIHIVSADTTRPTGRQRHSFAIGIVQDMVMYQHILLPVKQRFFSPGLFFSSIIFYCPSMPCTACAHYRCFVCITGMKCILWWQQHSYCTSFPLYDPAFLPCCCCSRSLP